MNPESDRSTRWNKHRGVMVWPVHCVQNRLVRSTIIKLEVPQKYFTVQKQPQDMSSLMTSNDSLTPKQLKSPFVPPPQPIITQLTALPSPGAGPWTHPSRLEPSQHYLHMSRIYIKVDSSRNCSAHTLLSPWQQPERTKGALALWRFQDCNKKVLKWQWILFTWPHQVLLCQSLLPLSFTQGTLLS